MANDGWDDFTMDDVDPDNIEGGEFVAVGRYVFEVDRIDHEAISRQGTPQATIQMSVVGGTTPGQAGKSHRMFLTKSEAAVKRALQFCLATKVTTAEELTKYKERGKMPPVGDMLNASIGRRFCAEVEESSYEDAGGNMKQSNSIDWKFYALDSPKAAGIPGASAGGAGGGGDTSNPFGSPPPATPPETTAPPAADPFGGGIPF